MNYAALLTEVLALPPHETGAQWGGGASPKRRAKEPPAEYSSTMLDVHVHNLLNMKRFHGVLAGNVHESSLKSRIGKVSCVNILMRRGISARSKRKLVPTMSSAYLLPLTSTTTVRS